MRMTKPRNLAETSARFDLTKAVARMIDTHGREEARRVILAMLHTLLPEEPKP